MNGHTAQVYNKYLFSGLMEGRDFISYTNEDGITFYTNGILAFALPDEMLYLNKEKFPCEKRVKIEILEGLNRDKLLLVTPTRTIKMSSGGQYNLKLLMDNKQPENRPIYIQKRFFDLFEFASAKGIISLYIKAGDDPAPVYVFEDGELQGMIMPVKLE